jgi:hypothetical protein
MKKIEQEANTLKQTYEKEANVADGKIIKLGEQLKEENEKQAANNRTLYGDCFLGFLKQSVLCVLRFCITPNFSEFFF